MTTTVQDSLSSLRLAMTDLQALYDHKYQEYEEHTRGRDFGPLDMVDSDGRPVLAPLLVALVQGYAALAVLDK